MTIKAKSYEVFCRALEEGIEYGWNRAHKHTESPDKETIKSEIEKAVMSSIHEVFEFDRYEV